MLSLWILEYNRSEYVSSCGALPVFGPFSKFHKGSDAVHHETYADEWNNVAILKKR